RRHRMGHALRAAPAAFRHDARYRVGRLWLRRREPPRTPAHGHRPLARRALLVRPAQQGDERATGRLAATAAAGALTAAGQWGGDHDTTVDRLRRRNVEHAR